MADRDTDSSSEVSFGDSRRASTASNGSNASNTTTASAPASGMNNASSQQRSHPARVGVMSHHIPHVLEPHTLLTPTTCSYCKKFIWGMTKSALICKECDQTYHKDCQAYILDDCGLTMAMLGGALSGPQTSMESLRSNSLKKQNDETAAATTTTTTGTATAATTPAPVSPGPNVSKLGSFGSLSKGSLKKLERKKEDKEKEDEMVISHNGHHFVTYTYRTPTWCKGCKNFIWGFSNQGLRCDKCHLDIHKRETCALKITGHCNLVRGGSLTIVASDEERQKYEQNLTSTGQVRSRRTNNIIKQSTFSRKSKILTKEKMVTPLIASLAIAPRSISQLTVSSQSPPSPVSAEKQSGSMAESETEKETDTTPTPFKYNAGAPIPKSDRRRSRRSTSANANGDSSSSSEETKKPAELDSAATLVPSKKDDSDSDDSERMESEADRTANQAAIDTIEASATLVDFDIDFDSAPLGSGQFGVVRVATYKRNGVKCAVKIINKKRFWGRKPDSMRHLKREIHILSSIKHEGIIQLYSVVDEPTDLFMFMELVDGGDLLQYVEQRGHVSEDEAKFLFHQLCAGVKYLHDRGIMHRDLKPENLLLTTEDGVKRLKIADFGFANLVGEKSFLQSVVGTPAYVAPEILNKNSKGYQKGGDIWSIGVILYACLSGVFPFDEDEPVEDQIKAGKFNFPDEYWEEVSDLAIDLCCNLLVVDPKQRYTIDDTLAHPWFTTVSQLNM